MFKALNGLLCADTTHSLTTAEAVIVLVVILVCVAGIKDGCVHLCRVAGIYVFPHGK